MDPLISIVVRAGGRVVTALLFSLLAMPAAEDASAQLDRLDRSVQDWQRRMLDEHVRMPEELRRLQRQVSVVPPLGAPAEPARLLRLATPPLGRLLPSLSVEVGTPTVGVGVGVEGEIAGRLGAGARAGFAWAVAEKQLAFTTSGEAKVALPWLGRETSPTGGVLPVWATQRVLIGNEIPADPAAGIEREIPLLKRGKVLLGFDADGNVTLGGSVNPGPTSLGSSGNAVGMIHA